MNGLGEDRALCESANRVPSPLDRPGVRSAVRLRRPSASRILTLAVLALASAACEVPLVDLTAEPQADGSGYVVSWTWNGPPGTVFAIDRWETGSEYTTIDVVQSSFQGERLSIADDVVSESDRKGAQYVYRVRPFVRNDGGGLAEAPGRYEAWTTHRKFWHQARVPSIEVTYQAFDLDGLVHCPKGKILKPSNVAKHGGNVIADFVPIGTEIDTSDPENVPETFQLLRQLILETRLEARRNNVPIRFFLYMRPDHMTENAKTAPGFQLSWLFRMPRAEFEWNYGFAVTDPSGWTAMTDRFRDYIWGNGAYYGFFYSNGDGIVLTDLKKAGLRKWMIQQTVKAVNYFGADGVHVSVKSGWLVDGHRPESRFPVNHAWCRSLDEDCSPYGDWGFEGGMGSYLKELRAAGLPVTINETPAADYPGSWLNDQVRSSILGNIYIPELPQSLSTCVYPD